MPNSSEIRPSGGAGAQPAAGPRDRASELEDLTQLHQQLASRYRSLLERYPGPIPAPHPGVKIKGKFVFIEVTKSGPKPLPPQAQRKLKQAEARRRDLLAIRQPFVSAWWPESSQRASPAQRDAVKWRAEFDDVANRTGEHYRIYKDSDRIKDLPLLHLGRTIGEEDLLRAIDRQLEIMSADRDRVGVSRSLAEAGPPASPESPVLEMRDIKMIHRKWIADGWHEKLKAARLAKDQTQKEAAHDCGLSGQEKPQDTYRRWETNRPPALSKLPAVLTYIGYRVRLDAPAVPNSDK